ASISSHICGVREIVMAAIPSHAFLEEGGFPRDEENRGRRHWPRRRGDTARRRCGQKARRVAVRLPFAEDLLAAWYCAFARDTPMQVKAALIGALAYFVLPFDAIPDVMAMLGFADDAAVLATALRLVASHMRPEHRAAA